MIASGRSLATNKDGNKRRLCYGDHDSQDGEDACGTVDDGFQVYVPTTVNPSRRLLFVVGGSIVCLMVCILPALVAFDKKRKRRKRKRKAKIAASEAATTEVEAADASVASAGAVVDKNAYESPRYLDEESSVATGTSSVSTGATDNSRPYIEVASRNMMTTLFNVLRFDRESKQISKYSALFTLNAVSDNVHECICLALIGHYCGTKQVAAYATFRILTSLTSDFVHGLVGSCTTLVAQAVGAGNNFLAGQFTQVGATIYVLFSLPCVAFWYLFTYDIILWLDWGDEETAALAQKFCYLFIWSDIFDGVRETLDKLLEVTGHEMPTNVVESMCETGAFLVVIVVERRKSNPGNVDLFVVSVIYFVISFAFGILNWWNAHRRGWLVPFEKGLYKKFALLDWATVSRVLTATIPLSFGSIVREAEWTILTIFASHMGQAEVVAWAILGDIWELSDDLVSGIGDAAKIRVAYHLGNNHPQLAKLAAYKSLVLGMTGASVVTIGLWVLGDRIPTWFTPDETLIGLMRQTMPFLAVGNLALHFGYMCWYVLGAQGRSRLGTWINFVVSWIITLPLGAYWTYYQNYNLEGLTAAFVLGYLGVGVVHSYLMLTSNWKKLAAMIKQMNDRITSGNVSMDEEEDLQQQWETIAVSSINGGAPVATTNVRLYTAPPGPLGVQIGNLPHKEGVFVTKIFESSPFRGRLQEGDCILAVDGFLVTSEPVPSVYEAVTSSRDSERELLVLTTFGRYHDEETKKALLNGEDDIVNFVFHELPGNGGRNKESGCGFMTI